MLNLYSYLILYLFIRIYFPVLNVRDKKVFDEGENEIPYTTVKGPLSSHFRDWLSNNGYGADDFAQLDLGSQASYGGRKYENEILYKRPVVFIHGNSDGALAVEKGSPNWEWSQGWSASIEHFLGNGYKGAELYAITYGDRNIENAMKSTIDCATALRMRRFLEAVLAYTGSRTMDIVAHSMGVTLARIAIQGHAFTEVLRRKSKEGTESFAKCFLGKSLHNRVHTFVAIAGANYGLCKCANETVARSWAACGKTTGFWTSSGCPNTTFLDCEVENLPRECHSNSHDGYSMMLRHLNRVGHIKEAKQIISIWSRMDTVLGESNMAWGHRTSVVPYSDRTLVYGRLSHNALKWATVGQQMDILQGGGEEG